MRKLIIVAAFVLSATAAHAGPITRGMTLASAQTSEPVKTPSVSEQLVAIGEKPAAPTVEAPKTTAAPVASAVAAPAARTETPKAEAAAEQPKPAAKKKQARRSETDEQKARRIAGRYGISW